VNRLRRACRPERSSNSPNYKYTRHSGLGQGRPFSMMPPPSTKPSSS
jgi:hypothetical protein